MSAPTISKGNPLAEEQVAEIKKVFSMCDKDGSGSIDAKELGTIIQALAGGPPSKQDLDAIMRKMDANNDGVISWAEFVSALSSWLQEEEEEKSRSSVRKRKSAPGSPQQARAKIHKRISNFFLQFKRASNFQQIREQYAKSGREADDGLMSDGSASVLEEFTSSQKLERIAKSKELIDHLPQITIGINSNDPNLAHKCMKGLADLLSICEAFQTPEERYEICDFLVLIFQRVAEAALMPRICKFLTVKEMPALQFEAARVVTFYGPGPRIAHTPQDSIFHPDKVMHKSEVVRSNGAASLMALLTSNCSEVREQAIVAIGRLASHDAEVRDLFLSMGVYPLLFQQINDATPPSLLYRLTWAISIFCGHTHLRSRPPPYDVVSQAMPKLAYLFMKNDEKALVHVITALSYLLPGVVMEEALCKRLCQMLVFPSVKVQTIVLSLITDVLRFDNSCIKLLLGLNLLPSLRELLLHCTDSALRLQVCELIEIIAGEKGQIQAVIEAQLVPSLIQLLNNDDHVRGKVAKVVMYLTRGIPAHVTYLVEKEEIVKVLSNALSHFKNYDSVLRDVYNFLGPSYNFDFVHDIASALENILKTGELHSGEHPYAKYFGMESVEKIRAVMIQLVEELADQLDAWRNTSLNEAHNISLEEQLKSLMMKIQSVHQHSSNPSSPLIAREAGETLRKFTETLTRNQPALAMRRQQRQIEAKMPYMHPFEVRAGTVGVPTGFSAYPSHTPMLAVKCFFGGDNRVIEVPRDVHLRDLMLRVQLKYGQNLVAQYEDDDGDKITIDTPEILSRAFAKFERQQSFKLYLTASPLGGAGTTGAPSSSPFSAAAFESSGPLEGKSNLFNFDSPRLTGRSSLMKDLSMTTHFTRHDLERLYSQFQKSATNGRLNKQQFENGLRDIGQHDQVLIDQLFNAFDYDKNGTVDFEEFAGGLSIMHRGSLEERLSLAFKAYDLDGNGVIDRRELFNCLRSSFRAKGFDQPDDYIRGLVEQCFSAADRNGDDRLDFDEFKMAVLKHQIVVQSFWKNNL